MIVVAGEALIDLVGVSGGDMWRAIPGGSPANVAVALARLGQPVRMLARLSTDAFGDRLRAHLAGNGVDLAWAVPAEEPTSLAIAALDADGAASYRFYLDGAADWQWSADELPAELRGVAATGSGSAATGASVVAIHTGSLALALAPGAQALEDLVARQRDVTVSIDLNLRPSILVDARRERDRVRRQIRHAHLVKASDEDLAWLYPGQTVAEVAAAWQQDGACCVVVTLGARGACLLAPDGVTHRQAARPVAVVDTVGAGDAFTAGMLAALADLGALGDDPARRLRRLTAPQWRAVLDQASAAAALTCGRAGADPPTSADLRATR